MEGIGFTSIMNVTLFTEWSRNVKSLVPESDQAAARMKDLYRQATSYFASIIDKNIYLEIIWVVLNHEFDGNNNEDVDGPNNLAEEITLYMASQNLMVPRIIYGEKQVEEEQVQDSLDSCFSIR